VHGGKKSHLHSHWKTNDKCDTISGALRAASLRTLADRGSERRITAIVAPIMA
jgi:hypothetical protein